MRRVKEGDFYIVPTNEETSILCRVLYKSNYFKHVALVVSYGVYNEKQSLSEQSPVSSPLYTTVQPKNIATWQFLENTLISETELLLSKRIVGGEVWLGDECLGTPTKQEEKILQQMEVYGDRIFLNEITKNT